MTKIVETCISCPTCNRPINPDNGPAEKKIAVNLATNRRNSLLSKLVDSREQIKRLSRDPKNKDALAHADVLKANIRATEEELKFLDDLINAHDPWWINK